MKHFFTIIILFLCAGCWHSQAEPPRGVVGIRYEVQGSDSLQVLDLMRIVVYSRPADMRKYARLVRNVKKVYPIAKEAHKRLVALEAELLNMERKGVQREHIRRVERQIVKEYTPVLKNMTFSQGKILIKLIDRQTEKTSYEILKEFRGGFRAALWQGLASLFDANLKESYDKDGEDKMIEQIITLYEAGLI